MAGSVSRVDLSTFSVDTATGSLLVLRLFPRIFLGIHCAFFLSHFVTKTVYSVIIILIRATCPTNLITLDMRNPISSEYYKFLSSSYITSPLFYSVI
jgi:hypothetical protein